MEPSPSSETPSEVPILAQSAPWTFACSQCGECCSQVSVPIESVKSRALQNRPWAQAQLAAHEATIVAIDESFDLLPHTAQGYCVFLGEDRRCLIQAREGLALKPDECQRYPFAVSRLPDGSRGFDYSLSCKSLAQTLLNQAAGVLPAQEPPADSRDSTFPARVRIDRWRAVDWRAFEDYRAAVAERFYDDALSAPAALRASWRMALALGRVSDLSAVETPANFRLSPLLESLILSWALRRPYGALNLLALWREGAYADPKVFGRRPIALHGLGRIRWDAQTLDPTLKAFLAAILRRYALIAYGHSLASVTLTALCALALVRWYARVLALTQEKPSPDVEDVLLAIRLTERYYTGHQPAFPEKLRRWPFKRLWLRLALGVG